MAELNKIDDHLYLGSLRTRKATSLLREAGIEVVAAVLTEQERTTFIGSIDGIDDYDITLDDSPQDDLFGALRKLIVILEREKGRKVLVHYLAGMSRSAALIIGYLMYRDGLSYEQAYKKVKEARPIIHPNEGFIRQLNSPWPDYLRH